MLASQRQLRVNCVDLCLYDEGARLAALRGESIDQRMYLQSGRAAARVARSATRMAYDVARDAALFGAIQPADDSIESIVGRGAVRGVTSAVTAPSPTLQQCLLVAQDDDRPAD